jgi:IS605 OrfB family transposase
VDGKPIKSINQWYNKRNACLQSIKDKQGIKGITNQQVKLVVRRNNQVRDYLNKAPRFIVNHCLDNQIAQLIVGYNPGIKQEINIGKCNNQNFVQIPFYSLRSKLRALCERYGLFTPNKKSRIPARQVLSMAMKYLFTMPTILRITSSLLNELSEDCIGQKRNIWLTVT